MQSSTFIGLDVHKATISVAIARGERGGEVRHWGTVPNRPDHVRKLVERLVEGGGRLHFCYEAGPCGYGLHRQLVEMGHECIVVAPSLIPVKAGDRVKTDRRDAVMLAKLHRAGELTAVWVPDSAHESRPLKKSAVWDGFPSDRSSEFSLVFFDAEGVRA
jgi:transposase